MKPENLRKIQCTGIGKAERRRVNQPPVQAQLVEGNVKTPAEGEGTSASGGKSKSCNENEEEDLQLLIDAQNENGSKQFVVDSHFEFDAPQFVNIERDSIDQRALTESNEEWFNEIHPLHESNSSSRKNEGCSLIKSNILVPNSLKQEEGRQREGIKSIFISKSRSNGGSLNPSRRIFNGPATRKEKDHTNTNSHLTSKSKPTQEHKNSCVPSTLSQPSHKKPQCSDQLAPPKCKPAEDSRISCKVTRKEPVFTAARKFQGISIISSSCTSIKHANK
eukprot:Nk52_evm1s134 gene=Nk52_evmTU1s134